MDQKRFVVSSGIKRIPVFTDSGVDTGRAVEFNPADQGFAEELYGLVSKLSRIHEDKAKAHEAAADAAERFDLSREEDAQMRAVVDSLFGEGFCKDVFKTRLFAMAGGLTVVESFLFELLDEMDASVTENLAKRDERIRKYTEKYSKYTRKYHN
ncbi:MAG: hypothetical protein J6C98_09655 [Oscillospiraceae bacterium]|nr:hypothetical protein [Oscillospiraceae bacterium]